MSEIKNKRKVKCRECYSSLEKGEGYLVSRYDAYSIYRYGNGQYLCENAFIRQEYYNSRYAELELLLSSFEFNEDEYSVFSRQQHELDIPDIAALLSIEDSKKFLDFIILFLPTLSKDVDASVALWWVRSSAYDNFEHFRSKWEEKGYTEIPSERAVELEKKLFIKSLQ